MLLQQLSDDYGTYQHSARRLALNTIKNYTNRQRGFIRWLAAQPPGGPPALPLLTQQNIRRYILAVGQEHPRSCNMIRAAIKHWSDWLVSEGWLTSNPVKDVPLPKVTPNRRQPVSEDVIGDMFAACDRLPGSDHKRALARIVIVLLNYTGLRLHEMLSLKTDSVDFKQGCLYVDVAKGGKRRTIYLEPSVMAELKRWLRERPEMKQDPKGKRRTDWLLVYNVRFRLANHGLYSILKELMQVAGLEGVKATPHQFRHSFATRHAMNGTPLPILQNMLGHNRIETTARYVHPDEVAQRQWVQNGMLGQQRKAESPQPTGKVDQGPMMKRKRQPLGRR